MLAKARCNRIAKREAYTSRTLAYNLAYNTVDAVAIYNRKRFVNGQQRTYIVQRTLRWDCLQMRSCCLNATRSYSVRMRLNHSASKQ